MDQQLPPPALEDLETRDVPAVVTPLPAAPALTPAAVVAPPVQQDVVTSPAQQVISNVPSQTTPLAADLGLAGVTPSTLGASATSPTSPFVEALGSTPAVTSLQPGSLAFFAPPTAAPSVLGSRGLNDAVVNLAGGPQVDRFLATALPPAREVTAGFQGRLVFPGTGMTNVRSPTLPGPFEQAPGLFLVGGGGSQAQPGDENPAAAARLRAYADGSATGDDLAELALAEPLYPEPPPMPEAP